MLQRLRDLAFAVTATSLIGISAAMAAEIRVACYSDNVECEVTETLAQRFMQANPDIKVVIDKVPYKTILEGLPVQLAAGNGPDIVRTTDFSSVSKYRLDLRPYLQDTAYWDKNFGATLDWLRIGPDDKGIYGLMTQLTVSGPFVNKSLFDQAGVPLPKAGATWDEWAAAVAKVAKATRTPFGMAWDRSGHRFAGPAISFGAHFFTANGTPAVIDDGFRAVASRFIAWNQDGTIEKDVWAGQGGTSYKDAFEEFANGRIVMYLSGSWQIARMDKQIGDAFEWQAVMPPCGPAACSGMPGGAAFVALTTSKNPKEVARFLDFLASEPVYAEWMVKTANIPAHLGLREKGLTYALSPRASAAMATLVAGSAQLSPVAFQLQGYRFSRAILNAIAERVGQAVAGQLPLDRAYERITADVDEAIKAAK